MPHVNEENPIIICEADYDSVLESNKRLYLPKLARKTDLGMEVISSKDVKALSFWAKNGADFVAISQTESAGDIELVRKIIGEHPVKVLAKIQNYVALKNLAEIIDAADGIIIERWTLSLDLPPAHLIFVQDYIINKCKLRGKPVILASRIMESMSNKPIPTPSDAADIALAINEGVDCFELSVEMAEAENALETLKEICKICISAEGNLDPYLDYYSIEEQHHKQNYGKDIQDVVCSSTINASLDLDVCLIIVFSKTGKTTVKLSKYRPKPVILSVTQDESVANFMQLCFGVIGLVSPNMETIVTEALIKEALGYAREKGLLRKNSYVVVTTGFKKEDTIANVFSVIKVD